MSDAANDDIHVEVHARRKDTGFSSAELGLYLFLAADVMFYGALYSSFALLRTAAEQWGKGHIPLIGGLGGGALLVLVVAANLPRWAAAGHALASALLGALVITLGLLGMPPAANTFYALVYLFAMTTLLHTLAGAITGTWLGFLKQGHTRARARLLRTYTLAIAALWGVALALLCFG